MNRIPRISVLMPAYNCEAYVADAIESILNQTFEDWEMIIADDGSTDETRQVIDQFEDSRICKYHSDTQLGVAHARNRLIQFAQSDLITWLDADDKSYSTRLEKLVQTFEERTNLSLCGSNITRRFQFSGERIVTQYPLTHDAIRNFIVQNNKIPFTGASVAFRRELLNDIAGFRPFFNRGGEDPDFILRVSENFCVGNLPDALYEVRYTRNSTSRQFSDDTYLQLYLPRIHFFLADQRAHNNGLDGLMEGGDKKSFDRFISELRQEFDRDRSIVYRETSRTKIRNQDYAFAFLDALQAVKANPASVQNYGLFVRMFGSLIKTSGRMAKQELLNYIKT